MHLLSLPTEILIQLPLHLHNIEDFISVVSTCRRLRMLLTEATSPKTILRLCVPCSRVFFRPDPYFLIAATASELSRWALLNETNYREFRLAIRGGIIGLYDLCLSKCGITLPRVRRFHELRFSAINPCIDIVDRCSGPQWMSTPDFWNGGVSDAQTLCLEPTRGFFQIIIYNELFAAPGFHYCFEREGYFFDFDTRLDFLRYCIPDIECFGGRENLRVDPIGPYAFATNSDWVEEPSVERWTGNGLKLRDDQQGYEYTYKHQLDLNTELCSVRQFLGCRTWREAWEGVRREVGPNFSTPWKQKMWENAVQMLWGLDGFEMLIRTVPKSERILAGKGMDLDDVWKGKLGQLWSAINKLRNPEDAPTQRPFCRQSRIWGGPVVPWDHVAFEEMPVIVDEALVGERAWRKQENDSFPSTYDESG